MISLFSIKDNASGTFMQPFASPARGVATRDFIDTLSQKDHPMSRHAKDYNLYFLGEFDPVSGCITASDTPTLVFEGASVKIAE